MLPDAAAAAMEMPNLETLELWNGREGLAMLFRYQGGPGTGNQPSSHYGEHPNLHWGLRSRKLGMPSHSGTATTGLLFGAPRSTRVPSDATAMRYASWDYRPRSSDPSRCDRC